MEKNYYVIRNRGEFSTMDEIICNEIGEIAISIIETLKIKRLSMLAQDFLDAKKVINNSEMTVQQRVDTIIDIADYIGYENPIY